MAGAAVGSAAAASPFFRPPPVTGNRIAGCLRSGAAFARLGLREGTRIAQKNALARQVRAGTSGMSVQSF